MEPEKKSSGALVGSIIVILVIILGGVYFWMNQMEETATVEETSQPNIELEAAIIQAENSLGAIESEMETSGIETLDLEAEVTGLE